MTTTKTTTEYGTDGTTVTGTTVMITDMMVVTTTVYMGATREETDIVTTRVVNPPADDGSTTVATTYGAMYTEPAGDDSPNMGETFSVKTDGNTIVTTVTTGAGDDLMVLRRVTTDENGAVTMRVNVSNSGNTEERIATAYMAAGGSTVTTTTWTRDDADDALEQSGNTVVVTNDASGRETRRVTRNAMNEVTEQRDTDYAADGSSTETRTFSGCAADATNCTDTLKNIGIVKRAAPQRAVSWAPSPTT